MGQTERYVLIVTVLPFVMTTARPPLLRVRPQVLVDDLDEQIGVLDEDVEL